VTGVQTCALPICPPGRYRGPGWAWGWRGSSRWWGTRCCSSWAERSMWSRGSCRWVLLILSRTRSRWRAGGGCTPGKVAGGTEIGHALGGPRSPPSLGLPVAVLITQCRWHGADHTGDRGAAVSCCESQSNGQGCDAFVAGLGCSVLSAACAIFRGMTKPHVNYPDGSGAYG